MKKLLNVSAAILFGIVLITATSKAQTTTPPVTTSPPASLPIGSMGMLRAYALEQVAGSSMSVWNDSIMWSSNSVTNVYFHPEVAPSLDEALQAIMLTRLSFKVSDKTKLLNVYADLHNKDGMSLFCGDAKASISDGGSIVCPTGVKMKMNTHLPIYVGENVPYAFVRLNDGSQQSLNVLNGHVFFDEGFTNKDGMLILVYEDGTTSQQIGYALRTGSQVPTHAVSGGVDCFMQDFQSFIDQGMLTNATLYANVNGLVGDDHEAPVASITITSTRMVKFSCTIRQSGTNAIIEKPTNGWIYKKGSDTETPVSLTPIAPGIWSVPIVLTPGEWFFYPETELFEAPSPVIVEGKG